MMVVLFHAQEEFVEVRIDELQDSLDWDFVLVHLSI